MAAAAPVTTPIQPSMPTATAAVSMRRAFGSEGPALNKINMNVKGAQVHLEALLDRKGIAALKRKLDSLEVLLDDEDEPDTSAGAVNME